MSTQIQTQNLAAAAVNGSKLNVLTTKGDLLGYDAGHIRLPAGSDKQALLANSSVTGGLAWSNVPRLLYANTSIPGGNTVANVVTEGAFSSSFSIPANTLSVGDFIRIKLWGVYGTPDISIPTLIVKLKFGSTTMLTTGALSPPASLSNAGWSIEGSHIVQSIGSNGTIDAQGHGKFATAATTELAANISNTSVFTIDTTSSISVTATAQWSIAGVLSTITLRQMVIELVR